MFVSHENVNSTKKKAFQKPNILRRKSNLVNKGTAVKAQNKTEAYESPDVKSLLNTSLLLDSKHIDLNIGKVINCKNNKPPQPIKKPVQKLKIENNATQGQFGNNQNIQSIFIDNSIINNNEVNQNQSSLNVESLLTGDVVRENLPMFDNDLLRDKELENQEKQKWYFDFSQDSQKIILEDYNGSQIGSFYLEQKSDIVNRMVPLAAVTSKCQEDQMQGENHTQMATLTHITTMPSSVLDRPKTDPCKDFNNLATIQSLTGVGTDQETNAENFSSMATIKKMTIEELTHAPKRYKCDIPNCTKEFMSEQNLKKHARTHNKDNSTRQPRQTTVECPVKIRTDGLEESCGRVFNIREELLKHLNEEHTIEEAAYRCTECSRRFFWATGLRAHGRSHAVRGRAALVCPWPGCARVFRQPCRLREHARAHTGDKPYPCRYPNCGWSFRTASKLLRHARRHTGERRHACGVCARAFLRREHLRDHAARHHAPHARRTHACPHADCQQNFTNMSSLYQHMKKVHRTEENNPPVVLPKTENPEPPKLPTENLFMVNLLEPPSTLASEVEVDRTIEEMDTSEEGHSARTHCTWPLVRTEHYQNTDACVLEEDVQVEQSEGSESNIYTVRSDLFLHGNILHNEDSEQMSRCVHVAEDGGALALDADLLLDAPSVHLDQNELYTDAVDESAFRVFLLSGEDLS